MKYKLINKKNEEHLCDKLTIDGFDYYVCGDEIFIGDWYFLPRTNSIHKCKDDPTELNLERSFGIAKLIATNNPSIDVPKVVDDVNTHINFLKGCELSNHDIDNWVKGYKNAKENYKFTKEDIYSFGLLCFLKSKSLNKTISINELFDVWLDNRTETIYFE